MNRTERPESSSVEQEFTEIAEEFLQRAREGERPTVDEYVVRYPHLAQLLREVLPALDVLAGPEGEKVVSSDPPSPSADPPVTGALGDFTLIREIGRGGMGVVYEALQISLGRRVAVKTLPLAGLLDQRQLERFRNEAQAAARLHHPHIVPVYAVGCDRGVHYFAMQLIEGRTLGEQIGAMRKEMILPPTSALGGSTAGNQDDHRPVDDGRRPLESNDTDDWLIHTTERSRSSPQFFRWAAELGVQAAKALAYAHSVGIIHRDIKPSNMLLDPSGHLWISDFGLAKQPGSTVLTMTGDLVGTLLYMSPEQAKGQGAVADQRSDIYALGASLYELLTLRPVFDGKERGALLRQIIQEEPRPLRTWNPALPRDLETIVLKALAKEPTDRYQTADELAADLQRFLDVKPIHARRPTLLERMAKFAQRQRVLVASAAAVILVALVASLTGLIWFRWQQVQLSSALDKAKTASDSQRRMGQMARKVVDDLCSRVATDWLANEPEMTEAESQMLETAAGYYESLAQEQPQDEESVAAVIAARASVAGIRRRMGQYEAAEKLCSEGQVEGEQALAEHEGSEAIQVALAELHAEYADLLNSVERYRETLPEAGKAETILLALHLDESSDYTAARRVIRAWMAKALAHAHLDQNDEADKACEQSVALSEKLLAAAPNDAMRKSLFANALQRHAWVANRHHGREVAVKLLDRALKHQTEIVAAYPKNRDFRLGLSNQYSFLTNALTNSFQFEEAEKAGRKALQTSKRLAEDYPLVPAYASFVANDVHALSRILLRLNRPDEAKALSDDAGARFEKIVQEFPKITKYRHFYAETFHQTGTLHFDASRFPEALANYRRAIAIQKGVSNERPELPSSRRDLAKVLADLAWFRIFCADDKLRDPVEGETLARQSLELFPEDRDMHTTLGMAYVAREKWREAIPELEYDVGGPQAQGLILLSLVKAHAKLGQLDRARQYWEKAQAELVRHPSQDQYEINLRAEVEKLVAAGAAP